MSKVTNGESRIKTCSKCKQQKPLIEYFRDMIQKSGLRPICKGCTKKQQNIYRLANKKLYATSSRVHSQRVKMEVLSHYGGGKPTCVRCGFVDIRALSIDHINSNGTEHRMKLGKVVGSNFYRWLMKQGLPLGYQTLCMNCQFIKKDENREHRK